MPMFNLKIVCSAALLVVTVLVGVFEFSRIADTYPINIGPQSIQQGSDSDSANVPIKVGDPIIIKDRKKK